MPPDLFDRLVETGFFRSLWPESFGGFELSLAELNELVIEGSRIDGSVGWLMMVGSLGPAVAGFLSEEAVGQIFGESIDVRWRGAIAPKGRAVPTDGGYLVSGQWPFASGGPAPQWFTGHCLIFEGDHPRIGPTGMPDGVMAAMPAAELRFLDSWHVMGLKGTDSCDVVAENVFVPEQLTFNLFTAENRLELAVCRLPIRSVLATGHASVDIGVAQGALDDIAALAATKRAAMNPTARLGADPLFQHSLGEEALRLESVKAFLQRETLQALEAAGAGRALTPVEAVRMRTMAGFVTSECVKVVDKAYALAGSTSVYESSSLQRRFRDIHVGSQHVAATSVGYRRLGALLAGEEVDPMALF
jgi:alkylation response protein AidB-like acyl-CoA dehydrogenase